MTILKQGPGSTDCLLGRSSSIGEGLRLLTNNFKIITVSLQYFKKSVITGD